MAVIFNEYEVHTEIKLSMSLKELLSSSKTKSSWTAYLAESLLAHFNNSATCSVIVAYDTKIKGRDFNMRRLIYLYRTKYWPQQQNILVVRYVFYPGHRRLHYSYQFCLSRSTCISNTPEIFYRQRKKI